MRTTSSLEAYNGVINNHVVNHGNFFTFVHDLRLQEFLYSIRFVQQFKGKKSQKQRREYQVENYKIICSTVFLPASNFYNMNCFCIFLGS